MPRTAEPEGGPGHRGLVGGKAHRREVRDALPGFRKYIQTLTPNLPMAYVTGGEALEEALWPPRAPAPRPAGPSSERNIYKHR